MEDHGAGTDWTRMVTSALNELRLSIWDVSEASLANHLSAKVPSQITTLIST